MVDLITKLSFGVSVLLVGVTANANCFEEAGKRYGLDPILLYSIAEVESSLNPSAINAANSNSTVDYGLMQINSIWLKQLEGFGASKDDLFDPCYNIHVGGWILAQSMRSMGSNWNGVGAYNAGTGKSPLREKLRLKYSTKVRGKYENNCAKYGCSGDLLYSGVY